MAKRKPQKKMNSLMDILTAHVLEDKGGYITYEFQDYGYRLACDMGEESKKGMYIKLAQTMERALLERARSFVMDAPHVNNRGRLFMWALGKLKRGEKLVSSVKCEVESR